MTKELSKGEQERISELIVKLLKSTHDVTTDELTELENDFYNHITMIGVHNNEVSDESYLKLWQMVILSRVVKQLSNEVIYIVNKMKAERGIPITFQPN